MPITIRELVIRTSIPDVSGKSSGTDFAELAPQETAESAPDLEALVQTCVAQVMERLREQHER